MRILWGVGERPIQVVRSLAKGLGFALVGVAPAASSAHEEYIQQWLATGQHGQMEYLAKHLAKRLDPKELMPDARSVICVADRYPSSSEAHQAGSASQDDSQPQAMGRVARYAWGDDYHKIIKKRLFALADALRDNWPNDEYRAVVDTAPVLEREHAQRAGMGWIGKHTLLIHPGLGSWMVLGEIVTTLEIQPDADHGGITDHCGTCTRCIDACPTGCISPYQLDAKRCISYLTIEHRTAIDPTLHQAMGDWVAGCDVCQEVCPHNRDDRDGSGGGTGERIGMPQGYAVRPPGPAMGLLDLLEWDDEARREALTRSALKRIKLEMFKRNALIAAGNYLGQHENPKLLERIHELADAPEEPVLVRTTAKQVLDRLESRCFVGSAANTVEGSSA